MCDAIVRIIPGDTPRNDGSQMPARVRNNITDELSNFDSLPASAFVGIKVVRALFAGRSKTTIYRWAKTDPDLEPVAIGPNSTGWNVGRLRRALAKAQKAAT